MVALRAAALAVVLAVVAACTATDPAVNEPQPAAPLGFFGLEFTNIAPPRFSSLAAGSIAPAAAVWGGPVADANVRFEPSGSSSLLALGDQVYVVAEFVVTNDTDGPLENLVLVGYHRAEFRAGSAVSQPVITTGAAAPDDVVRGIMPTHALYYEGSAGDPDLALLGVPSKSDFVAFAEDERPSLASFDFVETVFPYGFGVRSFDDLNGRTIAPGAQGQVHVAFALPVSSLASRNLGSFTWNAALLSLDHVRVAQAAQEQHPEGWDATLARATATSADFVVAIGPGTRLTPGAFCDRVLGLPNVRVSGIDPQDPAYTTLVPNDGAPVFAGCEGAP